MLHHEPLGQWVEAFASTVPPRWNQGTEWRDPIMNRSINPPFFPTFFFGTEATACFGDVEPGTQLGWLSDRKKKKAIARAAHAVTPSCAR